MSYTAASQMNLLHFWGICSDVHLFVQSLLVHPVTIIVLWPTLSRLSPQIFVSSAISTGRNMRVGRETCTQHLGSQGGETKASVRSEARQCVGCSDATALRSHHTSHRGQIDPIVLVEPWQGQLMQARVCLCPLCWSVFLMTSLQPKI